MVRALARHARGQWFESTTAHHQRSLTIFRASFGGRELAYGGWLQVAVLRSVISLAQICFQGRVQLVGGVLGPTAVLGAPDLARSMTSQGAHFPLPTGAGLVLNLTGRASIRGTVHRRDQVATHDDSHIQDVRQVHENHAQPKPIHLFLGSVTQFRSRHFWKRYDAQICGGDKHSRSK